MSANNLAHYRELAKLSQSDLADKSGLSQAFVSLLEKGQRSDVSVNRARKLVSSINSAGVVCTIDDVFPLCADRVA